MLRQTAATFSSPQANCTINRDTESNLVTPFVEAVTKRHDGSTMGNQHCDGLGFDFVSFDSEVP
jgi:hypothetical protein